MVFLHLSLVLGSIGFSCWAQNIPPNNTCNPTSNRVDPATHKFMSDCDSKTFCDSGTCRLKTCRTREIETGYEPGELVPTICPRSMYCPDDQSRCRPLLVLGQACELNRDDECAPPPNAADLASNMNFNGSVCLQFTCHYANMTLGQPCIIDTTLYLGLSSQGDSLSTTVSRDNCQTPGLYCDAPSMSCQQTKAVGVACGADNECATYNCNGKGVCADPPETPVRLGPMAYSVTATLIFGAMVMIVTSLVFVHKRQRSRRQKEIREYYQEQTTYRNSIIQLHTVARYRSIPFIQAEHVYPEIAPRRTADAPRPNAPVIQVHPPSEGGSVYAPSTL